MGDNVKLGRVEARFEKLSFPVTRDDAAAAFAETTVVFADGEANLGVLISETQSDTFHNPDELAAELNNTVPLEAVGDPGQSDGDA